MVELGYITLTAFARSTSSSVRVLRILASKKRFVEGILAQGKVCEHRRRTGNTKEPEKHNKLYETQTDLPPQTKICFVRSTQYGFPKPLWLVRNEPVGFFCFVGMDDHVLCQSRIRISYDADAI
jgi:hypothetical protein